MAPSPAPDLARSTPTNSELTKWKKSVQLGAAGCSARGLLTSMEGGRPRRVLGGQRFEPQERGQFRRKSFGLAPVSPGCRWS